jgi:hypothetical protein
MTMAANTYRAILAMDSYNRGYGANVNLSGSAIGVIQLLNRETLGITSDQYAKWQAAGFYAQAYNWNGENVISYRGTNFDFSLTSVEDFLNSPLIKDAWNGWTLGAGFSGASQGGLAVEFYKAVAGVSTPYYRIENAPSSTLLVGHSLGGGLAGFVGALSGEVSYGYDHMPFGIAAYAQAVSDSIKAAAEATGISLEDLLLTLSQSVISPGTAIFGAITIQAFLDAFQQEFALREPAIGMTGESVDGEVLEYVRNGLAQVIGGLLGTSIAVVLGSPLFAALLPITGAALGYTTAQLEQIPAMISTEYNVYSEGLSLVQRHSMPLLTTLIYGERQWASEGGVGRDRQWASAARFFLPAFFDKEIGLGLGLTPDAITGSGAADVATQFTTAIAYSAINEGNRVFGDTGIRSLFDDASDLGRAISLEDGAAISLGTGAKGIGHVITEYAGLLAVNSVLQADNAAALNGILTYRSIKSTGAQTLLIDLRPSTWTIAGNSHEITQKDEIVETFMDTDANGKAVFGAIQQWYAANVPTATNDIVKDIDRVSVALTQNTTLAKLTGTGVLLSVLGDAANTITYGAAKDFVIAGSGNDTLSGAGGSDILIGGAGSDRLNGGSGKDFLYGGSGADMLYGGINDDTLYAGFTSDLSRDELRGEAGNDTLVFNGGSGLAYGGTGNDYIDARKSKGVVVKYAKGEGLDTLANSYDFAIASLTFDNVADRDLNCRGQVGVDFTNLSGDKVYIVWNTEILDRRPYGDMNDEERLVHGNMSVFLKSTNAKIMDVGDVIGYNLSLSGSTGYYDLINGPELKFTDRLFQAGEGTNIDFRVTFANPAAAQQASSMEARASTIASSSTGEPTLLSDTIQFDTSVKSSSRSIEKPTKKAAADLISALRQAPRTSEFNSTIRSSYDHGNLLAVDQNNIFKTKKFDSAFLADPHRNTDRLLALMTQDMASFGAAGGVEGIMRRNGSTGAPVDWFA